MHRIFLLHLLYRVFLGALIAISLIGCGEASHESSQGNRPHKDQKLTDFVAVTTIGNLNMRIEPNLDTTRVQVRRKGQSR